MSLNISKGRVTMETVITLKLLFTWFVIIAAFGLAVSIIFWTFGNTNRTSHPVAWRLTALAVYVAGLFPSCVVAFGLRWNLNEREQGLGFPFPIAVYVAITENEWIEFEGYPLLGLVNLFVIDAVILLLVALPLFIVLRRRHRIERLAEGPSMNKLVKPVRELDAAARKKVEEGLQTPLADDQQIVVEQAAIPDPLPELPDWCNVYAGLSDQEIDELEKVILQPVKFRQPPE
jgi:hypothetical protein